MREAIEHKWARNTDPDKHGKQGNMSFRGMAAYSYATVVACKYPNRKGDGGVCVIAGEGIWNSSYTMRHKYAFAGALPKSWTRIWVDLKQDYYCYTDGKDLASMPGLRRAHEYGKTCVKELAEKVKNAKSYSIRAKAWKEFQHKRERVNSLGRFLKRADLLPTQYGLDWDAEDANLARWTAKVAERSRTCIHGMTKSFEEQLVDWRARKRAKLAVWNRGFYLRMSRDKKYVETSHGAVVPVGDARKLFKLCALIRRDAISVCSTALVGSVGPYALRTIEPNGDCVVGCHTLKYEEMEALHLANPEQEET